MKYKITLSLAAFIICLSVIAQGERKLNKNFSFVMTGKLDTVSSFSIEQRVKRSGWGEFSGALTQAFIGKGFTVHTNYVRAAHSYKIMIDYGRGFFASKMQFFDLRGQIIDINNNSEVLGTFSYEGRFEPDDISVAIAAKLKTVNPVIIKEEAIELVKEEPKENETNTVKQVRSKEDRLRELKSLFEKDLITKEEYDKAKMKIIEE